MVRTLQPNLLLLQADYNMGCRAQAMEGTGLYTQVYVYVYRNVYVIYTYIYIYTYISTYMVRESTLQSNNANFPNLLNCS